MPSCEEIKIKNLISGTIHRTNKARNLFLKHLHHDYDVRAGVFLWNHPHLMKYDGPSPLGKNQHIPSSNDPIKNGRKIKRGIVKYYQYTFRFSKRTFTVKTEFSTHGYEQLYALYELREKKSG